MIHNKKISSKIIQIFIILLIILTGILFANIRKTRGMLLDNIDVKVEYNNKQTEKSNNEFGIVNAGDNVYVTIHMPEKTIIDNPVICFYVYHCTVDIMFDGKTIDQYGYDVRPQGAMIGRNTIYTSLPDDVWGKDIEILLKVKENNAFNHIDDILLYEAEDAFFYNLDTDPIGFLLSYPMLLFGVISLLVSATRFRWDSDSRMSAYIGIFTILVSLYIIAANGSYSAFGLNNNFFKQIEFMSIFTVSIPILLYAYDSKTSKRMHLVLGAVAFISTLFFTISTFLNFTNILHYCDLLSLSNFITLISGCILIVYGVKQRKNQSVSNELFFTGMIALFITGIYEIIRMNIRMFVGNNFTYSLPPLLTLGVLIFLVYTFISYNKGIAEREEVLLIDKAKMDALGKIVSTIPTGVCLVNIDQSLSIIEANHRFYEMFNIDDNTKDFLSLLDFDTQNKIDQFKKDMITNKQKYFEMEVDLNNNPLIQSILIKMIYSNEDNILTINIIDISNQKNVERQLRIGEERYKLALEQSGKVFFLLDIPSKTINLSNEIADIYGLPPKVESMPQGFIDRGLIEKNSIHAFNKFFDDIYKGNKHGGTVVAGYTKDKSVARWFSVTYTTIYDYLNQPISSVLTFEDITEKRKQEIYSKWKEIHMQEISDKLYSTYVYNLTKGVLVDYSGHLFTAFVKVNNYRDQYRYVYNNMVHDDYKEAYKNFFDIDRLLGLYDQGIYEEEIEYLMIQKTDTYRWTRTIIQILKDTYTDNIIAQLQFIDIDESKTGTLKLQADYQTMKKELEQSRIKIMINQMQPHFLYNALSAIRTITKRDPEYAYNLLYDFSVHLRSSIKALSSDEPIQFIDELANIKAYLNIEQMRQGDRLKIKYDIQCTDFKIIPLSIQPIVENAVRHGIFNKGEAGGTVFITTYEKDDNIVIQVKDDGIGFDYDKVLESNKDSVGIKSLIFRLKTLMDADVEIHSVINKGTVVTVFLAKEKYKYEDNLN